MYDFFMQHVKMESMVLTVNVIVACVIDPMYVSILMGVVLVIASLGIQETDVLIVSKLHL